MFGVYIRALLGFHPRRARRAGVRGAQGGAVTAIQRFGGGLQLNVHLHTLVLEGVFFESAGGTLPRTLHARSRLRRRPQPSPSAATGGGPT